MTDEIQSLIWAAGVDDPAERETALCELRQREQSDPETLAAALCAALRSWDETVRIGAVVAMGELRSQATVPALCAALDGGDPLGSRIIHVLGRIGDPRAVPSLCRALYSRSLEMRRAAVDALAGIPDSRAAAAICDSQEGEPDSLRDLREEALLRIGLSVVPTLVEALQFGDNVARTAATVLVRLGAEAVPALCRALERAPWGARLRIPGVLAQIGDCRAVEPLIAALERDSSAGVRGEAALALGDLGAPSGIQPLLRARKDSERVVRGRAALALVSMGETASWLASGLGDALYDDDPAVRREAALSLRGVAREYPGPDLRRVLPGLRRLGAWWIGTHEERAFYREVAAEIEAITGTLKDLPRPASGPDADVLPRPGDPPES